MYCSKYRTNSSDVYTRMPENKVRKIILHGEQYYKKHSLDSENGR